MNAVARAQERSTQLQPADAFLEYQARKNFRDLCARFGFGGARQIIAEIINDEAERGTRQ